LKNKHAKGRSLGFPNTFHGKQTGKREITGDKALGKTGPEVGIVPQQVSL